MRHELITKELYSQMTDEEKKDHHRRVREYLISDGLLKEEHDTTNQSGSLDNP